jgi:hypothetical protein
VCRPELAVRRKPVVELFERFRPDAIQAALRVRAHLDEPGIFEDAEMLGDGRLAGAEEVDELADRPFAVAEQVEDRQTARLGKDLECSESSDANEYSDPVICLSSDRHVERLAVPGRTGEATGTHRIAIAMIFIASCCLTGYPVGSIDARCVERGKRCRSTRSELVTNGRPHAASS